MLAACLAYVNGSTWPLPTPQLQLAAVSRAANKFFAMLIKRFRLPGPSPPLPPFTFCCLTA